jgi:death-on-curing protein
LHSVARNHALIDGNKRTAWLVMRVFLRLNGVSASTVPPPVSVVGPFVEEVAQDKIDVLVIAKRRSTWFPSS